MDKELSALEQRLALLVAMPTETRNQQACQQAIDSLAEELRTLGLFVHKYDGQHPSLVATTKQTKSPKMMLVAHLDVVPATNDKQFELQVTAKKLKGRGVYDMKFAAACFLEFVHEYADKLNQYDIGIMFTTDEEIGGRDGVAKLLKNEGWRTEVAYIPDSSNGLKLEEKAQGMLGIELKATGRSAHGSRPWEGDNAITKLTSLLAEAEKKFPTKKDGPISLSIDYISGGNAINQVPDEAEAWIDLRSFSKAKLAKADTFFRSRAAALGMTYNVATEGDPLVLDKKNPYVKSFCESFGMVVGRQCEYSQAYGATDGRWFAKYDIPCIIIAPGGGDFHGPDEWLDRQKLATFYNLTVDFINRVHGFNGQHPAPTPAKPNLLRRLMGRVKA